MANMASRAIAIIVVYSTAMAEQIHHGEQPEHKQQKEQKQLPEKQWQKFAFGTDWEQFGSAKGRKHMEEKFEKEDQKEHEWDAKHEKNSNMSAHHESDDAIALFGIEHKQLPEKQWQKLAFGTDWEQMGSAKGRKHMKEKFKKEDEKYNMSAHHESDGAIELAASTAADQKGRRVQKFQKAVEDSHKTLQDTLADLDHLTADLQNKSTNQKFVNQLGESAWSSSQQSHHQEYENARGKLLTAMSGLDSTGSSTDLQSSLRKAHQALNYSSEVAHILQKTMADASRHLAEKRRAHSRHVEHVFRSARKASSAMLRAKGQLESAQRHTGASEQDFEQTELRNEKIAERLFDQAEKSHDHASDSVEHIYEGAEHRVAQLYDVADKAQRQEEMDAIDDVHGWAKAEECVEKGVKCKGHADKTKGAGRECEGGVKQVRSFGIGAKDLVEDVSEKVRDMHSEIVDDKSVLVPEDVIMELINLDLTDPVDIFGEEDCSEEGCSKTMSFGGYLKAFWGCNITFSKTGLKMSKDVGCGFKSFQGMGKPEGAFYDKIKDKEYN